MGLFFDKGDLNQRLEQATVRDHTNMRNWGERRKRRYDRVMNEPILPRFCNICFISMLIVTGAMILFDASAGFTYLSHLGILHMLNNVSTSAFFGWLIFAVLLIPCSLVQLHRGFDDPYFERFVMRKNGTPRMPLEKKFKMYVAVTAIGAAVLFVFYLTVRIFL